MQCANYAQRQSKHTLRPTGLPLHLHPLAHLPPRFFFPHLLHLSIPPSSILRLDPLLELGIPVMSVITLVSLLDHICHFRTHCTPC
jgi:hypothetical protein